MPTDGSVRGWPVPSAFPTLATDVVDVWGVAIDGLTGQVPLLFRSLASEERDWAERFHFQADRDRFIVARGLLRAILGRYLACDPDQVPIAYSAYGKPLIGPDA